MLIEKKLRGGISEERNEKRLPVLMVGLMGKKDDPSKVVIGAYILAVCLPRIITKGGSG